MTNQGATMNIPEEAMEKAAEALCLLIEDEPFDRISTYGQRSYRNYARAALSAAAPQLMAMAWDEGEQAGYENAKAEDWPSVTPNTNPYKEHQ